MEFYNNNFKSFRQSKELTHEETGKLLGISKQAIQAWESGKNKPRPSNVKKIAKLFNCSVIDISDLPPEKKMLANIEDIELGDEDVGILKYFQNSENKLERYELLAKIERLKNKSKGGNCLEEPPSEVNVA